MSASPEWLIETKARRRVGSGCTRQSSAPTIAVTTPAPMRIDWTRAACEWSGVEKAAQ